MPEASSRPERSSGEGLASGKFQWEQESGESGRGGDTMTVAALTGIIPPVVMAGATIQITKHAFGQNPVKMRKPRVKRRKGYHGKMKSPF